MQKQRSTYNYFLGLGRLISDTQKVIGRWSRMTKMTPIESSKIEIIKIKIRLSLTTLLFLIVSLKFLKKTSGEVVEEAL